MISMPRLCGLPVHVVLDAVHQSRARSVRTMASREALASTLRRAELVKLVSRWFASAIVADRLVEAQRIGDPVAREGIDLQVLPVSGENRLDRQVEIEHPLVEVQDVVDERQLEVRPGSRDGGLHRAEARTSAYWVCCTMKTDAVENDGDDADRIRQAGARTSDRSSRGSLLRAGGIAPGPARGAATLVERQEGHDRPAGRSGRR